MCTKRFHEVCILLSSKSFALISWITRDVDSAREHIPAVWRRENPPSFPESFSFPPFLLLPALYAFSFSNKPKCRPPNAKYRRTFLVNPLTLLLRLFVFNRHIQAHAPCRQTHPFFLRHAHSRVVALDKHYVFSLRA